MGSPTRTHALPIVFAVLLLSCGEPAHPGPPRPPTVAPAPPPTTAAPAPEIDDAALQAVPAETTVDAPLPAGVRAQAERLSVWLEGEGERESHAVLRGRLRVAGLLGLGRVEDYLRHARDAAPDVVREAKIAARRRLGLHRPSYEHLGVAGSSVSAGFLGTGVAGLLEEAAPSATVHDVSATLYFRKSIDERRALLDELIAAKPTLTMALDFLFWWTHGTQAHNLDEGMAQLDTIPGLLVVGTVPRMTSAKRWIMSRVRSREVIAEINTRIATWAATRPRVIVVPLATWYGQRDEADGPIPGDAEVVADELFAPDGLHLTALGTRFVVRRSLAAVAQSLPDAPPPLVPWTR